MLRYWRIFQQNSLWYGNLAPAVRPMIFVWPSISGESAFRLMPRKHQKGASLGFPLFASAMGNLDTNSRKTHFYLSLFIA